MMKLEDLPEMPKYFNSKDRSIALEQRLAFSKYLLIATRIDQSDHAGKMHWERVHAFVQKLNMEGF